MPETTNDWAIYRYEGNGVMRYVARLQANKEALDHALVTMAEEHGDTLMARPYFGSARPAR